MIVLGIDQASESGWAVHTGPGGRVVAHGVARTWQDRHAAIQCALDHAGSVGSAAELLVVFEDHSGISLKKGTRGKPTRSTASILGLGAARGRWDEALDRVGHPDSKRIQVEPKDWRGRVLGLGEHASTDLCKKCACEWATRQLYEIITDHNEAEGICITCWGALDGLSVWQGRRNLERAKARGKKQAKKQGVLDLGGKS